MNKRTGKTVKKEYAEVNQRVKAFRMVYPKGRIITEMTRVDETYVIFEARVYDEYGSILSTGHAEEKRNSSDINRTSAVENCETSAVGRALGLCGFGIDTAIASYEEVTNANLKQEGLQLATKSEKEGLMETCRSKGVDIDMILTYVGFDRDKQPEGMTVEQYGKAMNYLNNKKEVK
jgi:hypothetical protein